LPGGLLEFPPVGIEENDDGNHEGDGEESPEAVDSALQPRSHDVYSSWNGTVDIVNDANMTDTNMGSGLPSDPQSAAFLDRLVHDLREPLRSINVFSELLAEMAQGRLGAEANQLLNEIYAGSARMRTVLEGLSGYSLALGESSGSGSGSLQSAFQIVVAALDDQIQAYGATVTGLDLPKVDVGLDRLMQLLENLIGNSLRFRSEAPPVIRISAVPEAGGMWAVSVEDNGIGIAPEDCEAIFTPFMRVEGKKYGGAGLGLSTCKRIVEAHGGTIRMESTLGHGSVCTFTLPEA
jgi:signal transduction histidine kinase